MREATKSSRVPSPRTIAITGTGDTVATSYLATNVLATAGFKPGLLGSLGYFDGVDLEPARWKTPPAPVLSRWLSRMREQGCSHAVLEVSSRALREAWTASIDFDVACLHDVPRRRPSNSSNPDREARGGRSLFDQLLPEGFAIANGDDPRADLFLSRHDGPALTVGLAQSTELIATPLSQYVSEQTFLLSLGSDTVPVRTGLIGIDAIYNCLFAAAVGVVYGLDLTTIARGIESVACIPGCLERVECGQPFGVFVDSSHSPRALARRLKSLREVTNGKLICVFGPRSGREGFATKSGQVIETLSDTIVVTHEGGRRARSHETMSQVVEGLRLAHRARVMADRTEAIGWALGAARAGDCVLIVGGRSSPRWAVAADDSELDDRDVARQWLYGEMERPLGRWAA